MSDDLRATRLEKVEQLKQLGVNPYAYQWQSTHHAAQLQEKYADLANGEEVEIEVAIAAPELLCHAFTIRSPDIV